ncbi:MmcQ/YjbR family DNA-binding protein [Kocuria sediminis]|uniref:MmcQ/YjbR family DNA-binding protein n=2 Tax=Kocuria sediminis TaxID=1038857 RepID=A0A6N8GLT7_9MICC|nr:MmcQ/YjbR family DNA-binding protein [Kocuria sediminis]MUN63729.1 MmcQ/YjbR family DNA-binding protein [Kocuria sediminis]
MEVAAGLPAVSRTCPFGPEHDVFKVAGKIFLMATEATGEPIVTLKCEPPHAAALRQEFPTITPGYHMNKQHWISLAAGPGVTRDLVAELVLNAYELVVDGLPRAERPVLRHADTGPGPTTEAG